MDIKDFLLQKWQERSAERGLEKPFDLSGACKFAAAFAQRIHGGEIEANEAHTWLRKGNEIIDYTEDSQDTRSLLNGDIPASMASYFSAYSIEVPENLYEPDREFMMGRDFHDAMKSNQPRVDQWEEEWKRLDEQSRRGWLTSLFEDNSSLDYSEVCYKIADDDQLFEAIAGYVYNYESGIAEDAEMMERFKNILARLKPSIPDREIYRGECRSSWKQKMGRGVHSWTPSLPTAKYFVKDCDNRNGQLLIIRKKPIRAVRLSDIVYARMKLREVSIYGGNQAEWFVYDEDAIKYGEEIDESAAERLFDMPASGKSEMILKENAPRTLYHGTLKEYIPDIMRNGLVPTVGEFVSNFYEPDTEDEYYDPERDSLEPLVFAADKNEIARCVNAIRHRLQANGIRVTPENIIAHGAIIVIKDVDEEFIQRNDEDNPYDDHPIQVEPKDYYTDREVIPAYILTGKKLKDLLRRKRIDGFWSPRPPIR